MPSFSVPLDRYEKLAARLGRLEGQLESAQRLIGERDRREAQMRLRSEALQRARHIAEQEARVQRMARERVERRLRALRSGGVGPGPATAHVDEGHGLLYLLVALAPLWLIPLEGYLASASILTIALSDATLPEMLGAQMAVRVTLVGLALVLRRWPAAFPLLLLADSLLLPLR